MRKVKTTLQTLALQQNEITFHFLQKHSPHRKSRWGYIFIEKKDILTAAAIKESGSLSESDNSSVSSNTKEQWLSSKEEQARLKKLKNNLARVEEQISSIEERLKEIDEEYMNPDIGSNTGRLMELHKEKEELDDKLNNLYEQWEEISTEIG